MDTTRRPIVALATMTLAVALAACGGGGSGSTTASSPPSSGAAGAGPSAVVDAPAGGSPSTGGAAGDGAAGGVCDLVTPDELATAFGVAVSTSVIPGPPDGCVVQSDAGRPLASWSHTTSGAGAIYGGVVMPGQSTEVSGIGDRAAFVDNMGFLVLKGDSMVVITIASGADLDAAAAQEVSKQLGALVAGRM